jgi:hypothetical protein
VAGEVVRGGRRHLGHAHRAEGRRHQRRRLAGSEKTTNHSDQELVALTNLLEDKFEDLDEGSKRSIAEMLWRDGSQDAKAIPGVQSFILGAPTTGTHVRHRPRGE